MTGSPPERSLRFRPDIEGLRAVAILGVICFHAGIRATSGGFLGVDVFFVLSGFLITGILVAEIRTTGTISLPAFWTRRIRRLLPAATLVSLVTLLLSATLDSPFAEADHGKSAMAFATYWSNLLFVRRGADYFNATLGSDPYLHTWSLAVEEQFYLVFAPLCLVLVATIRKKDFEVVRRRLLKWAIGLTVLSFVGCLLLTAARPIFSFYSLPSRAWEFGIGGMLAVILPIFPQQRSARNEGLAAGGLSAVVVAFLVINERSPNPSWLTLVPVLGTAAVIFVGGTGGTLVGRLLETPFLRWLGRLSYSWYLWHWPLTVYWAKLVPGNPIPTVVGMPLVSLALAQLTYLTVEAPIREGPLLRNARRGLLAAAVLALMTTAGGFMTVRHSAARLRDPDYGFILRARDTRNRLVLDGCELGISDIEPKPCSYGNPSSDTIVVLFGDSHAAQLFTALEPLDKGWRLIPMTKAGCPSVVLRVLHPGAGREYFECERWRRKVFESLRVIGPRVVVIANSSWYQVLNAGGSAFLPKPPPANVWRDGMQGLLDQLPQASEVLLLEDTPNPHFDVAECLLAHVHNVTRCSFRRDAAFANEVTHINAEIGKRDPRVTYLDLSDHICDGAICPAGRADTVFFIDDNHLSVAFAGSLSPWFRPAFRALLAPPRGRPGSDSQPGFIPR